MNPACTYCALPIDDEAQAILVTNPTTGALKRILHRACFKNEKREVAGSACREQYSNS